MTISSGAGWKRVAVKKSAAHKVRARKRRAKTKPSSAQNCWPGFKPTPGKSAGEKGSCEPKSKQTKVEKKADARAAAARKLQKAHGNKAKARKI
jgi:hypothetical protein